MFQHYFSSKKASLVIIETVAIFSASALAVWATESLANRLSHGSWALPGFSGAVIILLVTIAFQYSIYLFDLYDLRIAQNDAVTLTRHLKASALLAFVLAMIWPLFRVADSWYNEVLFTASIGAVVSSYAVRKQLRPLVRKKTGILVVGDLDHCGTLARNIEEESEGTLVVRGVLSAHSVGVGEVYSRNTSLAGGQIPLVKVAERLQAQDVVVSWETRNFLKAEEVTRLENALLECRVNGMNVFSVTDFIERSLRKLPVALMETTWFALNDEFHVSTFRRFLKRTADLILASVLLLLSLPIGLLTALAIRLDSQGPIFYHQERVGLNGKVFRLWKFRSMTQNAEAQGAVWAKQNDSRVTRVGKWIRKTRIDEIPQVLNVLAGDMSFVGPRPERPIFVEEIKKSVPFYRLREKAKPGLTGWAQIRYPYGASVEDAQRKLEYDLYYVKNASLAFDLAIVFHTLRHVLQARGAR